MIGAGLIARKAAELGLESKPWVKTICAPGSQVVDGYFRRADLWKGRRGNGLLPVRVSVAPPVSVTPAHCQRKSPLPSTSTTWLQPQFCRVTVTSKAASPLT